MKKLYIIIIFLLATVSAGSGYLFYSLGGNGSYVGFNTLDDVDRYASSYPEFPPMDNDRNLKPDYTSHYKKNDWGWVQKIKNRIFGHEKKIWSPRYFRDLLVQVTNFRITQGYDSEHIIKFTPVVDSKIIIWGDLQGAFHSFLRDLKRLRELKVINNDLKIVDPKYYFVFNGDLVSRSPYIMETLTLATRLMDANPDQVIYIKGNHEMNNYWQGHGLKRELRIRAKHLSHDNIPLEKEINTFFDTLPLSLFLSMDDNNKKFTQISHVLGDRVNKLDIMGYSGFLAKKEVNPVAFAIHKFEKETVSDDPIIIRAIITGQDREFAYEKTDGLLQIPSIEGATSWTVLSCPTLAYREEFDFKHDAFVILDITQDSANWTLTLHNQNVEKMDGFKTRIYQLLTGERLDKEKASEVPDEVIKESSEPVKEM